MTSAEVALEVEDDDLDCSLTLLLITASRPLLLTQFEFESLLVVPEYGTLTLEDNGGSLAEEPLLNFSPFRERGAETMASSEVSAALPPEAGAEVTLASDEKSLPFVRFVRAPFKISAGVGGGAVTAADGALSFFASGADCCAELGACVGG